MICILVLNSLNRVSSEQKLSRKNGKFRKTDFAEFREEKNCSKKCKKNCIKNSKTKNAIFLRNVCFFCFVFNVIILAKFSAEIFFSRNDFPISLETLNPRPRDHQKQSWKWKLLSCLDWSSFLLKRIFQLKNFLSFYFSMFLLKQTEGRKANHNNILSEPHYFLKI